METAWAHKSRARLTLFFMVGGLVLLALYLTIALYRPPTCFDGKVNQDEVGTDCGGVCSLLCVSQTQELKPVWSQAFRVSDGWYSALAYIENANLAAQAEEVPYRFRFYDKDSVLITERTGLTYVTKDPVLPVFVGRVDTQSREVERVTFELLARPVWHRDDRAPYRLAFEEQRMVQTRTGQDLMVIAHNQESIPLHNVRVVAVLYGKDTNAIAASETYIDTIQPQSKRTITFPWPEPFTTTPVRIEILPRIPLQE